MAGDMSKEDVSVATRLRAMAARCRREAANAADIAVRRELRVIASRCEHLADRLELEEPRSVGLR